MGLGTLTTLDYIILVALAVGVWRGTRTGAIGQVIGLVGLLVAFWFAVLMMAPAGKMAVLMAGVPDALGPVVGFVVVCVAVILLMAGVGLIARKALKLLRIGFLDTGLGGLLGGVRAAFVLSLFLLVTSSPAIPGSDGLLIRMDTRESSVLYEPIRSVAPSLWDGFRVVAPGLQHALLDRFEALTGGGSRSRQDSL